MRNIFIFIFSLTLIFSSSCAMKKLAVHQFDVPKNFPTKTSPFSKDEIFSATAATCAFGIKDHRFTDDFPLFISQVSKPKFLGPFSGIDLIFKTNIPFPPDLLFLKTKKYSFSTGSERLYLMLGRIIYYA